MRWWLLIGCKVAHLGDSPRIWDQDQAGLKAAVLHSLHELLHADFLAGKGHLDATTMPSSSRPHSDFLISFLKVLSTRAYEEPCWHYKSRKTFLATDSCLTFLQQVESCRRLPVPLQHQ